MEEEYKTKIAALETRIDDLETNTTLLKNSLNEAIACLRDNELHRKTPVEFLYDEEEEEEEESTESTE